MLMVMMYIAGYLSDTEASKIYSKKSRFLFCGDLNFDLYLQPLKSKTLLLSSVG